MVADRLDLRAATPEDVDAMARLEAQSGDVRWTRAQVAQELNGSHSRLRVLILEGRFVGYGGYWKVADEAQISNIVITPEYRRIGLGCRLLDGLLKEASAEGCGRALLEVRASNAAAQGLYTSRGFKETGRRSNFYQNPTDDAVLMEKQL